MEAVGLLREVRRQQAPQNTVQNSVDNREPGTVCLSAADPLNLVGLITPGARLPALAGNRVLYRDGLPVAVLAGGEVRFLGQFEPAEQWQLQNLLLRRQVPAQLADLA